MNPSTQPSDPSSIGTVTAMLRALPTGTDIGWRKGSGTVGCTGLCSSRGSQSSQKLISLASSVTISENIHHVGGLGDPPNVRRSDW
jgi:hypothetical protein